MHATFMQKALRVSHLGAIPTNNYTYFVKKNIRLVVYTRLEHNIL
jgi:hypothetical protein